MIFISQSLNPKAGAYFRRRSGEAKREIPRPAEEKGGLSFSTIYFVALRQAEGVAAEVRLSRRLPEPFSRGCGFHKVRQLGKDRSRSLHSCRLF